MFSGRSKSLVVDGSGNGYLKTVCDYVHLNAVRAKLVKQGQEMEAFEWSSYPEYLKEPGQRAPWLRVDRLFGQWRIPKDSEAGRREFARPMEERRHQEDGKEFKPIARGWCLGDDAFRRELMEQMDVGPSGRHYGSEVFEALEAKAERIIREGLAKAGLSEEDLERTPKGDQRKVKLAAELRTNTTMTLDWMARRLRMGTRGYARWLLERKSA